MNAPAHRRDYGSTFGDGGVRPVCASYSEPINRGRRGNPVYDAILPVPSREELMQQLKFEAPFDPRWRRLQKHERRRLISDAQLFVPFTHHLAFGEALYTIMQKRYAGWNPLSADFSYRVDAASAAIAAPCEGAIEDRLANAGMLLAGIGGLGKSYTTYRLLRRVPQRIVHSEYRGQEFQSQQLTYLLVTCPEDASLKAFLESVFDKIDGVMGGTMGEAYLRDRPSVSTMVGRLARCVARVHLGLLVIDEAQHLKAGTQNEQGKLLRFLVRLQNDLGVPVLLIGNLEVFELIRSELRLARRMTSEGDFIWDRFATQTDEFDTMLRALWRQRLVRAPREMSRALQEAFYKRSAGIPDLVVKLFKESQRRAIEYEREEGDSVGTVDPHSVLSPAHVNSAADRLRTMDHIARALVSEDRDEDLKRLRDRVPRNLERYLEGMGVVGEGERRHEAVVRSSPTKRHSARTIRRMLTGQQTTVREPNEAAEEVRPASPTEPAARRKRRGEISAPNANLQGFSAALDGGQFLLGDNQLRQAP
jgi:hypothetical protein